VIVGDQVYGLGGQGQFFCLGLDTGRVRWSGDFRKDYGLADDIFAMGCSPLVVDHRIILNIGAREHRAGVIAMDRETGRTLWTATDHGAAYCSPMAATIHGQDFVFVMTNIGLVSLDPATGRVDWMIEHRSRTPMSPNAVSPLVDGDKVLAISWPGPGALCVEVLPDRGHRVRWKKRRVIDSQYNTLISNDGLVYGFAGAGQDAGGLRCVELATGRLRWRADFPPVRGQGVLTASGIIVLGEQGHLASILPSGEGPVLLASTPDPLMKGPCYCSPALGGYRLLLKDETRVACFDLAPRGAL
jgi:outer membrane protein assembly factor BamB